MAKITRQESQDTSIPFRIYSSAELAKFDQKIQPYYKTVQLSERFNNDTVRVLDHHELAVAYGAFEKRLVHGSPHYSIIIRSGEKRNRLEQLQNLLKQWLFWKSKKQYGEEETLKAYDEMVAQGMMF
jgi:hypothetical protein